MWKKSIYKTADDKAWKKEIEVFDYIKSLSFKFLLKSFKLIKYIKNNNKYKINKN